MDSDEETYIILLLSDSGLPTGSFVASSGLESYIKHGFSSTGSTEQATVTFLKDSLASYARTSLPFVSDAHRIVSDFAKEAIKNEDTVTQELPQVISKLTELDGLYNSQVLNHVARRASNAQGAALLTLYTKGFSRPSSLSAYSDAETQDRERVMLKVVDRFKLGVRRGDANGHLPICWGVLTAALGLTLDRSQYLHLFLHARSILSASIRLNELGPYNAQQILLHAVRPLVDAEASRCQSLRTGLLEDPESGFDEMTQGPATTWPLGEILATRHDLQHSRIFNS